LPVDRVPSLINITELLTQTRTSICCGWVRFRLPVPILATNAIGNARDDLIYGYRLIFPASTFDATHFFMAIP
jgi:hypothetical protein